MKHVKSFLHFVVLKLVCFFLILICASALVGFFSCVFSWLCLPSLSVGRVPLRRICITVLIVRKSFSSCFSRKLFVFLQFRRITAVI